MTSSNESEYLFERNTIKSLKHLGRKLLKPLPPVHQLLQLLHKLKLVLSTMDQAPTKPIQKSLVPSMKASISDGILRHTDEDVKISITSCITEITRITAPDAPYDDEQMSIPFYGEQEIFKLIVAAFEKLSLTSGHCYEKALTILDNVSKVRLCLVMLDLECDDLISQMFQHFLRNIRSNHPRNAIDSMETIMTLVLDESEEISSYLLRPLLDGVRNENQTISPTSWTLGEKVITNCAVKLKPYLMKAVESSARALDEYARIVTSIFHNGPESPQHDHSNGSKKTVVTKGIETNITCMKDAQKGPSKLKTHENMNVASPATCNIPDESHPKRGRPRKRSSTGIRDVGSKSVSKLKKDDLNPLLEESSLESPDVRLEKESEARKDSEVKSQAPIRKIKISFKNNDKTVVAPELVVAKMGSKASCKEVGKHKSVTDIEAENREEGRSSAQSGVKKRRRHNATPNNDLNESSAIKELITKSASKSLTGAEETPQTRRRRKRTTASETRDLGSSLVGSRIRVWWPMDKMFYEGVVIKYDPVK